MNAQENTHTYPINFQMEEYSEIIDTDFNKTSIDFSLPSSDWNMTDFQINFSNITSNIQTKVIDGGINNWDVIEHSSETFSLAVEIELAYPITLYAVEIFGYTSTPTIDEAYVQIQGCNAGSSLPNSIIYGSPVLLNISITPNWYLQTFKSPITLPKGHYFLVIDGSSVNNPNKRYYWEFGESGPLISAFNTTLGWQVSSMESPFCYKLIQREKFNPSEIGMQVEIDGVNYTVSDSSDTGTGDLTVNDICFFSNSIDNSLNVFTDQRINITFNYDYHIFMKNSFISGGYLTSRYNSENSWLITPEFNKVGYNYSVRFFYPNNWYNISVFRNNNEITSNISYYNTYLLISNNLILDNCTWEVTAKSSSTSLGVDSLKLEYDIEEIIFLTIEVPISEGNVTFKLISSSNVEVYSKTININQTQIEFSLQIPEGLPEGLYEIFILWQNSNQAGVQTQLIFIKNPIPLIDLNPLIILASSVIVGITIALTSYSYIKMKNKKIIREDHEKMLLNAKNNTHRSYKELLFNLFRDHFNLRYILINEKKSGLTVYSQNFTPIKFNTTLVSGFLDALDSFGRIYIDHDEQSVLIKIDYRNSVLIFLEFKFFKIIFIMKQDPSIEFVKTIKELSKAIDKEYAYDFKNFNNSPKYFESIQNLIHEYLHVSLAYPLCIELPQANEVNHQESSLIKNAFEIMKITKLNHFYVKSLISMEQFEVEKAEIVLNLIKREIVKPAFYIP